MKTLCDSRGQSYDFGGKPRGTNGSWRKDMEFGGKPRGMNGMWHKIPEFGSTCTGREARGARPGLCDGKMYYGSSIRSIPYNDTYHQVQMPGLNRAQLDVASKSTVEQPHVSNKADTRFGMLAPRMGQQKISGQPFTAYNRLGFRIKNKGA